MSVVTRCGAVSLLLSLFMGAAPALAQTSPGDASGSSWTDPPVRGSAAPDAPAPVKPAETKPSADAPSSAEAAKPEKNTAAPPAATPAERAAETLGVKPADSGKGTASKGMASSVSSDQAHRSVVRPRMVELPMVIARRRARLAERTHHRLAHRISRRAIRSYAFKPDSQSPGRVDPYDGRRYASTWSRRRLTGWGGLIEDNRVSRIARARESGYTVMRMQTYEYPDGTRVRRLAPFDGGGFSDLD